MSDDPPIRWAAVHFLLSSPQRLRVGQIFFLKQGRKNDLSDSLSRPSHTGLPGTIGASALLDMACTAVSTGKIGQAACMNCALLRCSSLTGDGPAAPW